MEARPRPARADDMDMASAVAAGFARAIAAVVEEIVAGAKTVAFA